MRCLPVILLLAACSPELTTANVPQSSCAEENFDGSAFIVCSQPGGTVEIRNGQQSFATVERNLGQRASTVAFAMNAGMFDERGGPIGLAIEDGRQLKPINRRAGSGNFHLKPNGVFLVRMSGRSEVISSERFVPAANIRFASQSGPMLVVDGKLHPRFDPDGQSRYVRNGVGIAADGTPTFVISSDAVSLGKFGRFFRDRLRVRNALYFDGSVSSLWDPANARMDNFTKLGPIVMVFKGAVSAPGRAARATP